MKETIKKNFKQFLATVLATALVVTSIGFIPGVTAVADDESEKGASTVSGGDVSSNTISVNNLNIGADSKPNIDNPEVLVIGDTLELTATASVSSNSGSAVSANDITVSWNSTSPDVASVSANEFSVSNGVLTAKAKVTAISAGSTKIEVYVNGVKDDHPFDVVAANASVREVKLNKITIALTEGETEKLTATVEPSTADPSVSWNSSDTSVATVDQNGNVKAVKAGTATVKATSVADPSKSATCNVTVNPANGGGENAGVTVTLSKTATTLTAGQSETLTATVTGSTNKSVTWSSTDTSVATVDANGKVTAVKAGKATVTAKAVADPTKSANCVVTVNAAPATDNGGNNTGNNTNNNNTNNNNKTVSAKSVKISSKTIYLVKGKSVTLGATVTPTNSTDNVKWSTKNKKIATVSSKGKVTGKAVGKTTITVTAGKKFAKCTVNVVSKATKATKVKLNKKKATVKVKKTVQLTATLSPKKSTDTIKWSSSNKKVAKVDNYGLVTGVKKGTATITAKASSGKKATCKITVK